jgi:hypothetical protein
VFTFGYDASVVFTRSTARINTIADNLLDALGRKRKDQEVCSLHDYVIFVEQRYEMTGIVRMLLTLIEARS